MKEAQPSDYPFNDMFDGKWRVAFPLEINEEQLSDIKRFFEDLLDLLPSIKNMPWASYSTLLGAFLKLQEQGYKIDYPKGVVYKIEKQTNPKTGELLNEE